MAKKVSITSLHRATSRGSSKVPYLRMSGRWLEQLGFPTGTRVIVSGEPGKLVLTVAEKPTS